jgi:hypothetical protein
VSPEFAVRLFGMTGCQDFPDARMRMLARRHHP